MHGGDAPMIRAAGGVLWRPAGSGAVEVALVHRPEYDDWSLPKGKLRRGEHPLVTACREVAEETGIRAVAGKRLDVEHYDTALGPKAVEYWAMHGPDAPFTATAEVDRLAWLQLTDARRRLDYQRDVYAIDALEVLADGAAPAPRSCSCATPAPCPSRDGQAPEATARWTSRDRNRPRPCAGRCRPSGHPGCCRHARPVSWTPCDRSARSSGCRSKPSRPSAKTNTLHIPAAA